MATDPKDDASRITKWAAEKLGAVMVLTVCDGFETYVVRKGADRRLVAEKLREMAREVEET